MNKIFDASEVWSLLIPLIILSFRKDQPAYLKPIIIYIWVALLLNTLSYAVDVFFDVLPASLRYNTIFYNVHALSRFLLFSWFFIQLKPQYFIRLKQLIISIFLIILVFYFSFIDSFFNLNYISADMMAGESFFLLCLCMVYYLTILRGENPKFTDRKDFWVVTGLAIFCVINFFIFLFYMPLLDESIKVTINIWVFYQVAFLIFISFISTAIYVPATDKH